MAPDMRTLFVNAFLKMMCSAMDAGHFSFVEDRLDKKNRDTMVLLQYTINDVMEEFRNLKRPDYRRGPTEDRDFPGDREVWEFRKFVASYDIYFKVIRIKSLDWYIGISFHVTEPRSEEDEG